MRHLVFITAIFSVSIAGCEAEEGDVGSPCDSVEDCADGLICDVHDGKGTCQEGHGHDDGGESGESSGTGG